MLEKPHRLVPRCECDRSDKSMQCLEFVLKVALDVACLLHMAHDI
jgi:hypothetical protein